MCRIVQAGVCLVFMTLTFASLSHQEKPSLVEPAPLFSRHRLRTPAEKKKRGISPEQYAELKSEILQDLRDTFDGLFNRIVALEQFQNELLTRENQVASQAGAVQVLSSTRKRRNAVRDEEAEEIDDSLQEVLAEVEVINRTTLDALQTRLKTLEGMMTKTTARSCDALWKTGTKTSGTYMIDPDGADFGEAPIEVYCNFLEDGVSETVISHESFVANDSVSIKNCGPPGCSEHQIKYKASSGQMNALMEISTSCQQEITYNCFSAPLSLWGNFHYSWWIGSDGSTKKYHWSGGRNTSEHICACGMAGNCTAQPVLLKCNCDAGVPEWLSDHGIITDKENLPIQSLHFGGLKYASQKASFSLGPLKCSGANVAALTKFDSCRAMRIVGHRAPGYYLLDSKAANNDEEAAQVARVARCNFDLHTQNPSFEETVFKLGSPVIFNAGRSENVYSASFLQLTGFDLVVINRGEGFDPRNGTFTAPVSGIYFFSFLSGHSVANNYLTATARIHKNDVVVAETWDDVATYMNRGSMTATTIIELTKGDLVHVSYTGYLRTGGQKTGLQFMGYMLVPL